MQQKLIEQRLKEIEAEKKERARKLKEQSKVVSENEKDRVKKGLEALGLEGREKAPDELEKRKNLFANLKGIIKK